MFTPEIKEYFGIIAVILTFIGFAPYIRGILQGKIKPHTFTWVIWAISTLIVFAAQVVSNAAAGSWAVGLSGFIALFIAILAHYKAGDDDITKSDWLFLFAALSAMPLWYLTSDPLWAVVIITVIDVIAYAPTMRKVYHKPNEEQIAIFIIMSIRTCFVLAALGEFSLTNILFQAVTMMVNLIVIILIIVRRSQLK